MVSQSLDVWCIKGKNECYKNFRYETTFITVSYGFHHGQYDMGLAR